VWQDPVAQLDRYKVDSGIFTFDGLISSYGCPTDYSFLNTLVHNNAKLSQKATLSGMHHATMPEVLMHDLKRQLSWLMKPRSLITLYTVDSSWYCKKKKKRGSRNSKRNKNARKERSSHQVATQRP
jgi:hypothetical protein